MGKFKDENIKIFIDESFEHLSDIENELLEIEQLGADIDESLVNKVYRAAHSIKGGAGFMGLANIKNLTHEMENILGKIRAREMVPDAGIIDALLKAADVLRNLLNDIENSNDADISEHMAALNAVSGETESQPENAGKKSKPVTTAVHISSPGGKYFFDVPEEDIRRIQKEGKNLYLIQAEAVKCETLTEIINDMKQCGLILARQPEGPSGKKQDPGESGDDASFSAMFATVLKPEDVSRLLRFDAVSIYFVNKDHSVKPVPKDRPDVQDDGDGAATEKNGSVCSPEAEEIPPPSEAAGDESSEPYVEDGADEAAPASEKTPSRTDSEPQGGSSGSETGSFTKTRKSQSSLRVNINLLDSLMTLAGELVLSRNQLIQAIIRNDHRALEVSGQRIDLITSELQEAIMHTRMQPIQNIFGKFPRVVRDLALTLDKKIELFIEGKEVELDKSIIENLNDPMTHLIRNAADHGIELPETRIRQGKNPAGRIHLKAYHEAGQVNIEIRDDGRGIDGGEIAKSAAAKGLVSEEQVREMSAGEKVNLIFLPGFSIKNQISDLSGRGVGMDVVKTNLEALGGVVDIDSEPGNGTAIHIKLPLTLAIIPSLLVSDGNERYAIPQVNVVELLRIPPSRIKERIEHVGNARVVRLRDELLPLIRLSDILNPAAPDSSGSPDSRFPRPACEKHGMNIVAVFTGIFKFGIIVDKLHDSEEIVVKPLGRHLRDCRGYAGATILGDGRVALILDVSDLAQIAELASLSAAVRESDASEKIMLPNDTGQTLLLFRNSETTRFAVPLELVERIEKIRCSDIEVAGGRRVLRFRDASMPLFDVGDVAQVEKFEEKEHALVIIFFVAGLDVGILAVPPIDTVKTAFRMDETALRQPGISGSALIDGRTTLIVDVIGIVEAVHPEWFSVDRRIQRPDAKDKTILLAEDSRFFRNQMQCAIEDAGYNVLVAEDGMIALDLLKKNEDRVSLVVTDLEMPNMDGFEFTRNLKNDERFSRLPVIAVSSLAGKEDIKKAKKCGVDKYQVKLDRRKLMECIRGYLGEGGVTTGDAAGLN